LCWGLKKRLPLRDLAPCSHYRKKILLNALKEEIRIPMGIIWRRLLLRTENLRGDLIFGCLTSVSEPAEGWWAALTVVVT
jgi:hypothetical protein